MGMFLYLACWLLCDFNSFHIDANWILIRNQCVMGFSSITWTLEA